MGHPTLPTLLRRAAERHGDRPAVIDRDRSLTYAELDARSTQVAHLLREIGVERGDRVGLYIDKSLESLVGIYAVLKAGAAYVPFDPSAPVHRLGYIARDCGIQVLLTGAAKERGWPALQAAGAPLRSLVVLDAPRNAVDEAGGQLAGVGVFGTDDTDSLATTGPSEPTISLDLAYILYTSGSTGEPKGVMLTHRNALAFVEWAAAEFQVGASDRLSSHAPLHFDLSVFDLFAAAWGGATVVIVPPKTSMFPVEVVRLIREQEISVWYSVPSILSMLVLRGGLEVGDLPSLRVLLFAGEVFPTRYLRRLMQLLPHPRFANLYGPTETNVCTWYEVPSLPESQIDPIPIGRAIDDDEVFAITDDGRPAAPGEVGELFVRGSTVMQGYWGDPDRTAARLVTDPLRRGFPDPVYRTGDLAYLDQDGNWHYVGRRDAQIKSRGYRIELGEIEAALYAQAEVQECAVVAVPDELVTNRIKAFVVTRAPIGERALARAAAERVPSYMVPEMWEFRDELPRTSTGKIDRRALTFPPVPTP
jgi:amino acid adenylation domain-containing protein